MHSYNVEKRALSSELGRGGGNIHTAPSEDKNEGSLPSKPRPQPRMNESVKRKEEKRKEKEEKKRK